MKRRILRLRLLTLAAWLYDIYRLVVKPRTRGALVALWCQGLACSERPLLQVDGLKIVAVEWLKPEQALAREGRVTLRGVKPEARLP